MYFWRWSGADGGWQEQAVDEFSVCRLYFIALGIVKSDDNLTCLSCPILLVNAVSKAGRRQSLFGA